MLFSQKKLAKLKQTEQTTEQHVYGRNAAVEQVMTHDRNCKDESVLVSPSVPPAQVEL